MQQRTRTLFTALYGALVVALTLAPVRFASDDPWGLDKWVHAAMFGILAYLIFWSFRGRSRFIVALATGVITAALVELIQGPLPYRSADPADFVGGALGAVVGAVAAVRTVGE